MATPNRKVLDISHHNDVSSWNDIKAAGIIGVIHKATEGTSYVDSQYLSRCAPCMRAGLMWGAYHFGNSSNVQAQVDNFLKTVGVDDSTLYALDWEDDPNGNTMSVDQAKQFITLVEQRIGGTNRVVVYSGNTAKDKLGTKKDQMLGAHRLWLAQYSSSPVPQVSWNTYWIWQYSDGSSGPGPHGCPGVSGDVDTNSWAGSDAELKKQWTGAVAPAPGPTPPPLPDDTKPTLRKGDRGPYVKVLQGDLNDQLAGCRLAVDGDFGSKTDTAVRDYQRSHALGVDGICGQQTWNALETEAPFVPPPPSLISPKDQEAICQIASNSAIQQYNWQDRGIMPPGYCQGMALAFAVSYLQLLDDVSWSVEMAKANTHNSDKDALSWYAGFFKDAGMGTNDTTGPDTLRHLFVLMLGLGMRESSGRHCEGRDMSASNVTSDTCEAGLFQQSWNSSSATSEMQNLMDAYDSDDSNCYLDTFKQGVSCSSSEWDCYGSGDGYRFQEMCKSCPVYCAQSCGVGLRNIRQHWGPISRYEVEVRPEADDMFKAVEDYLDESQPVTV